MGSSTAAGTTIAIGAAAPLTFDAAGYGALTLTEVGGVESIGAIGANTAKTEFQPLKGPKQKHKGSTDYGSLQPAIAHDDGDAGQNLLRTASAPTNNALYSVGVTYPNGRDLSGAVAVDYGMSGVPESYFVDRTGQLVRKWQGPLDDARLRVYLDELLR